MSYYAAKQDPAVEALRGYAAATLYEANGKGGDCGPDIFSVVPGKQMIGRAATVRCLPGDSRGVIELIATAEPGSVLAIDVGGSPFASAWGGTSSLVAKQRGLAGVVTNGAVRDVAEVRSIGLPVFAAGYSVRGTQKSRPGEMGIAVAIGSAAIAPGDIISADDDGVVVVPTLRIDNVIVAAAAQREREEEIERRVRDGEDLRRALGL
ncbi:RraA family protein [Bradyrhizobium sp. 14AA]